MRFTQPSNYKARLRVNRLPAVSIYPATLLEWMWRHKHPHIQTFGFECNRWGERNREGDGLGRRGTFWYAINDVRDYGEVLHCNSLPYDNINTATFNEESEAWEGGDLVRGWRSFLCTLTGNGLLYPSNELSYLLGEDSWAKCPRKCWE